MLDWPWALGALEEEPVSVTIFRLAAWGLGALVACACGDDAFSSDTAEGGAAGSGGDSAASGGGGTGQADGGTGGELTGCDLLCSHADDCASDSEAACMNRCEALASNPDECQERYDAFSDCMQTAEFSCNDEDLVSVVGCEGPAAAALACTAGIDPDPGLVDPCEDYCTEAAAADCENSEGVSSCVSWCTIFGAGAFPCAEEWNTVLTCSEDATFECDANGNVAVRGCELQVLGFAACVLLNPDAAS